MFQINTQLISHHTEGLIITSLQVVALVRKTRKVYTVSVQVVSLQTGLVGLTRNSEEKSKSCGCAPETLTPVQTHHISLGRTGKSSFSVTARV